MHVIDEGDTHDMIIIRPDNIRELVIRALASELPNKNGVIESVKPEALSALGYLCDVDTDLVRDEVIRKMVIEYATCRASGYRDRAARALHDLGDPLGILYLTYDCLSTHPITGQFRPTQSGWSDIGLIQCATDMTDECIDLLIQDILNPPGYLHADALSALPAERIVDRMLPLLDQPVRIAAQAAYVLALKGRDEGRAVLEQIAETMNLRFLETAIIGLSHIPNQRAVELIRGYTDPKHHAYSKDPMIFAKEALMWPKTLLAQAMQRLLLLDHELGKSFLEVMKRLYMLPTSEWTTGSVTIPAELVAPTLFIARHHDAIQSAPDFIAEFATEADRKALAEIQTAGMREFLKAVPVPKLLSNRWPMFMLWNRHPMDSKDFNYTSFDSAYNEHVTFVESVFGVEVINDEEDYLFAATDWILNPQYYRIGSHRYFPRSLGQ